MPIKYSKISDYRLKKLMRCFCSDIDATKTAEIIGLKRNTLNPKNSFPTDKKRV